MRPPPINGAWAVTSFTRRPSPISHRPWSLITRPYSTASEARVETHEISCGSAGYVTVDIYNSHALTSKTTPLIIHLPPTGTHLRSKHPPIPAFLLSDAFRAYPLASINYRWNHVPPLAKADSNGEISLFHTIAPLPSSPGYSNFPFPTPLHDTLHAFTWITDIFIPSLSKVKELRYPPPPPSPYSPAQISPKTPPRPLIIYGSRLGGTLATSLGLTETRISRLTNQIAGVIVRDGIFDWTGIATSLPKNLPEIDMTSPTNIRDSEIWAYINNEAPLSPPLTPSSEDLSDSTHTLSTRAASNCGLDHLAISPHLPTTATLHQLKTQLFTQPSSCFDNFASPILFFRTPGFSIPRFFPGTKPPPPPPSMELGGLSLSEAERADLEAMLGAEEEFGSSKSSGKDQGKEEEIEILRKSMLKFPQANSGLKIPRALFLVSANKPGGKDQELLRQAEEMAKYMRRSVLMHEFKDRAAWDEDLDPESAVQDRVQMHRLASTAEGEVAEVVGEWMEDLD